MIFTDTNSGLDQIPINLDNNDLYTFARAIQDYIGVQQIEGRPYNMKQMSQLYLIYLNEPLYQRAKLLMQTRMESCPYDAVPISLQVPGLATTITQQTLQLSDEKFSDVKHYDTVTNLSTITFDTITTSADSFDKITSSISPLTTKFNGKCKACGRANHQASEYNFFMKLKQCLACMKTDNTAGSIKAKFYKSKGDYNSSRDKVRSLQEDNFIPPILDPDIFFDIADDDNEPTNHVVPDNLPDAM